MGYAGSASRSPGRSLSPSGYGHGAVGPHAADGMRFNARAPTPLSSPPSGYGNSSRNAASSALKRSGFSMFG